MANDRTLFERLLEPDTRKGRTASQRKDVLVASILNHLRGLLNTRQGSCETLPDYGMPEMVSTGDANTSLAQEMENDIRNTISRYEPRLTRIQVRMEISEENRLMPRFLVTARLTPQGDFSKDVSFSTIVDPMGGIKVD